MQPPQPILIANLFPELLDALLDLLAGLSDDEWDAAEQTLVALTITGASGGTWFLLRERATWQLYLDIVRAPDAQVTLDPDTAWRLFTKGIGEGTARAQANITATRTWRHLCSGRWR